MSAVALPALTRAALTGFPIAVAAVASVGGGRGLVATRAVGVGEVVLSETPLVATPPPGAAAACGACLAPVAGSDVGKEPPHCSPACAADLTASGWAGAVAGARGFTELELFGEKFALLAARAAVRHVAAALKLPGVDVEAATAASAALHSLARARVSHPLPPRWIDTHAAFTEGATRWLATCMPPTDAAAVLRELVPVDGWAALLATAHVNAVRVDVPPPPVATHDDFAAALDALATDAVTAAGAGSALYAAASMANHSCAPSVAPLVNVTALANHSCVPSVAPLVNVTAPAQLTLVATRALAPGDAVTLAYVDDDAPVGVRRAALEEGYGFLCQCERCVEESET